MRLPKAPRIGVQSLGREDVGAPARTWQAKTAMEKTLYAGALQLGSDVVDMKNKYDVSQADAHVIQTMTELQGRYDGADEIDINDPNLSGITFDKKDELGQARTTVPKHEVYPQMYANASKKAIEEGGGMIAIPNTKAEWSTTYTSKAQQNQAVVDAQSMKANKAYKVKTQEGIIANQMEMGMYDAALGTLDNYVGSDQRADELRIKARVGIEDEKNAAVINSQDPDKMIARAEKLEDLDTANVYSNEIRLEEATRLRKTAEIQKDQNDAQAAHEWVQKERGTGKTTEQKLTEAKAIEDPEVSKLAQSAVRQDARDEKQAKNDYQEGLFNKYYDVLTTIDETGGRASYAAIPAQDIEAMGNKNAALLRQVARNPAANYNEDQYLSEKATVNEWSQAVEMGTPQDLQDFAALDISTITAGWDASARADALALHTTAKEYVNKKVTPTVSTYANIKKDVYDEMFGGRSGAKLSADEREQKWQFTDRFDQEIATYTEDNKKKPDSAWMRNKAKELRHEDYVTKGRVYGTNKSSIYGVEIEGVPTLLVDDYSRVLRERGEQVNEQNIIELHQFAQERGISP